jgi:hypothetical protein
VHYAYHKPLLGPMDLCHSTPCHREYRSRKGGPQDYGRCHEQLEKYYVGLAHHSTTKIYSVLLRQDSFTAEAFRKFWTMKNALHFWKTAQNHIQVCFILKSHLFGLRAVHYSAFIPEQISTWPAKMIYYKEPFSESGKHMKVGACWKGSGSSAS